MDPTENGDEPPYAYPAVDDDPGIARLRTHLEAQGWKPFSLPLGVNLDEEHPVTSPASSARPAAAIPAW